MLVCPKWWRWCVFDVRVSDVVVLSLMHFSELT